jgi:type II secretory pathway pseudopilin PulG
MKKTAFPGRKSAAFTLVELLASIAVLLILIALIFQILNLTTKVSLSGNKRMDADTQARSVFDRMAVDFGRMVIRKDVDYYIKQATASSIPANGTANADNSKPANPEAGNDQIAFYSQVPGYYSASSTTSDEGQLSLVAYRINANPGSADYNGMERLGKGLVWSATSNTNTATEVDLPMVCYPIPIAVAYTVGSATYQPVWPQAGSGTLTDPNNDYELIGPEVFRFEYYYNLKKAAASTLTSTLSNTPWDSSLPTHTSLCGWQDVASITVAIAVVDARTRLILTPAQIVALAGTMNDSGPPASGAWLPGQLEAQWRTAIQTAVTNKTIPALSGSGIRVYSRTFYLTTPAPP